MLERLLTPNRIALALAALGLAIYVGYCARLGWYVGGRPGYFFEGKSLVIPTYVAGLFGAVLALIGVLVAAGGVLEAKALASTELASVRGATRGALVTAGLALASLVASFWEPWGLGIVYAVSDWRQG
jgi:hypothetical protein